MMLSALGCMNNADLKKIVNDNTVLDVFIIFQKLRHIQLTRTYSKNFKVIPQRVHSPRRTPPASPCVNFDMSCSS